MPLSGAESAVQAMAGGQGFELLPGMSHTYGRHTEGGWSAAWAAISEAISQQNLRDKLQVALVAALNTPEPSEIEFAKRSVAAIDAIAGGMWLGDALLEERVMCYLQPVLDTRGNVFGFESFVRARGVDGKVIGGDKVVAASKALGIEYLIDRHLHVEAIRTFTSCGGNGALFVNFFPGFIHRPAVYLEGLSDAVRSQGLIAKNVVLDFTRSETPKDINHLRSVVEYCRSRGFAIALDDLVSVEVAARLVTEIRPDYVKIDRALVNQVATPIGRSTIEQIASLAHSHGGVLVAEGVETEDQHGALKRCGVDLFQGYLFSPPVSAEDITAKYGKG